MQKPTTPGEIATSSMTLHRYCTISSAKAFNASVASWQNDGGNGSGSRVGGGGWRCLEKGQKGGKVITCTWPHLWIIWTTKRFYPLASSLWNAQLGNASIGKESHANRILLLYESSIWCVHSVSSIFLTPPKINIEPENDALEDDFKNSIFHGCILRFQPLIFRGVQRMIPKIVPKIPSTQIQSPHFKKAPTSGAEVPPVGPLAAEALGHCLRREVGEKGDSPRNKGSWSTWKGKCFTSFIIITSSSSIRNPQY